MDATKIFVITPITIEEELGKLVLTYDPKEYYDLVKQHPDAYLQPVDSAGEPLAPMSPIRPIWEMLFLEETQTEQMS